MQGYLVSNNVKNMSILLTGENEVQKCFDVERLFRTNKSETASRNYLL